MLYMACHEVEFYKKSNRFNQNNATFEVFSNQTSQQIGYTSKREVNDDADTFKCTFFYLETGLFKTI